MWGRRAICRKRGQNRLGSGWKNRYNRQIRRKRNCTWELQELASHKDAVLADTAQKRPNVVPAAAVGSPHDGSAVAGNGRAEEDAPPIRRERRATAQSMAASQ